MSVTHKENLIALESKIRRRISETQGEPPVKLYHYSDLTGLHSMLKTGKFWCTDVTFTNDKSEVSYGLGLVRESVGKIAQEATSQIVKNHLLTVTEDLSVWMDCVSYYIACFCEEGDNLSQWRAYGAQGQGASLGVEAVGFDSTFIDGQQVALMKVIYDRDMQKKMIDETLEEVQETFKLHTKNLDNNDPEKDMILTDFITHLYPVFLEICLMFKDASFADEKEWRLIYLLQKDKDNKDTLETRVSKNFILPYVSYPVERSLSQEKGLVLKEIIQGPQSDPDRGVRAIEILIAKEDWHEVKVNPSLIPFRF
jgi:DUF2971 family protein